LELFRVRHISPFVDLSPDPPMTAIPVPLRFPIRLSESGPKGDPDLSVPDPGLTVIGLRLFVEQDRWAEWPELTLRWRSGPGGSVQRSERVHAAFRPCTHSVVFYLNVDKPSEIVIQPNLSAAGLTLHRAEWLVQSGSP